MHVHIVPVGKSASDRIPDLGCLGKMFHRHAWNPINVQRVIEGTRAEHIKVDEIEGEHRLSWHEGKEVRGLIWLLLNSRQRSNLSM